jgi:hypothetical protein
MVLFWSRWDVNFLCSEYILEAYVSGINISANKGKNIGSYPFIFRSSSIPDITLKVKPRGSATSQNPLLHHNNLVANVDNRSKAKGELYF